MSVRFVLISRMKCTGPAIWSCTEPSLHLAYTGGQKIPHFNRKLQYLYNDIYKNQLNLEYCDSATRTSHCKDSSHPVVPCMAFVYSLVAQRARSSKAHSCLHFKLKDILSPRIFLTQRRAAVATISNDSWQEPTHSTNENDTDLGGSVHGHRICIEYCTGCRWGLRASWIATELLLTFDGIIGEIALRPGTKSGVFSIWVVPENGPEVRIWCRKESSRFPELKELKQRVRDVLSPEKYLGHSDCR